VITSNNKMNLIYNRFVASSSSGVLFPFLDAGGAWAAAATLVAFLLPVGLLDLGDLGDFVRGDLALGDLGVFLPSFESLDTLSDVSTRSLSDRTNSSGFLSYIYNI
jgi:hypothetical protein